MCPILIAITATAQDPAPPPTVPFQSLETKLEATETFSPQFQLNRINLDFTANFMLGQNASIDPVSDNLPVQAPFGPPGSVRTPFGPPGFVAEIPAGCFGPKGGRFRVSDPAGCGVSIRLEFPPNSNTPPIDMTPGLEGFNAVLSGPVPNSMDTWPLRIDASFLDIRQEPQPCFLPILGGAGRTIVRIGNDIGENTPRKLEVIGGAKVVSLP